jgi:elongation factor P
MILRIAWVCNGIDRGAGLGLIHALNPFNKQRFMAQVNSIRKGNVINYNGEPCLVLECVVRTPPNLRAFCQMQLRNLKTGKVIHNRTNASDSYDVLHKEIRELELSYINQGVYSFMDNETFESVELDGKIIEDAKDFLVVGATYEVFYVEQVPMGIQLPAAIEMKVVEAPEAVRGDSSGNVQKPVTLETGLVVRTPLFIKEGDVIRVSTEERTYLSRA